MDITKTKMGLNWVCVGLGLAVFCDSKAKTLNPTKFNQNFDLGSGIVKTLDMRSVSSLRQAHAFAAKSLHRLYNVSELPPSSSSLRVHLENEKRRFFSSWNGGIVENVKQLWPRVIGSWMTAERNVSAPYMLGVRSLIHSTSQKDVEHGNNSISSKPDNNSVSSRPMESGSNTTRSWQAWSGGNNSASSRPMGPGNNPISERPMDYVRGVLNGEGRTSRGLYHNMSQGRMERDADIVNIKLLRNNTFVTVTDSKGNKKLGASSGCLPELKGGPKLSRYAAEATAEHVGRLARNYGLKSVVIRVNGFTHFKKKKNTIMSYREGFGNIGGEQTPIVYIEDSTRKPHNGCRLPKKRRI